MKSASLHIIMVVLAACFCASCSRDHYSEPVPVDDGQAVSLTFDMRVLGFGSTRVGGYPAERVSTLRVVIVDLGIDNSGKRVARPTVERNMLLDNVSLAGDVDSGLPVGVARLQFPKIRADRRKKIYLLINSEPTKQTYLDLRLANGTKINTLNLDEDNKLFLPDNSGRAPIEDATFVSPQGSYAKNNITSNEELLVPMTAFHTISIPTIEELIEKYPSIHTNIIYPLPSELYVVRAINKITFEFCNKTYSTEKNFDGIDLLIREWSISEINKQAYLFGHPGDNGNLFSGKTSDFYDQVNAPWMQWLKEEAEKTQSPDYKPYYEWMTEYSMPNKVSERYSFRPGTYTGSASTGTAKDSDGYVLPAPADNTGTMLSTEEYPVYFGESHSGTPQQYELAFTVWQLTQEQKENGESWNNPYTYRAISTATSDDNNFNLQSLFRNTHVVVKVIFSSGLGRPDMQVDVHPYGNYELDPVFGL